MTVHIVQQPVCPTTSPDVGPLRPATAAVGSVPSAAVLRWVGDVLTDTALAGAGDLARVRVLRDGTKRLAEVELTDGTALVLKQYADDRGAWTQLWLHRLTDAGLTSPSSASVTVSRGWSGTHRTLVADLAPGDSWKAWLLGAEAGRDAAAIAAAEWLLRLQSLPVALPDRSAYRAGEELRRQSGQLAVQRPSHAARLFRITDAAHGQLYADPRAPDLVAAHGDLHPGNLFLANDRQLSVTAIDVDTAGLRRAAYDVGYALAQLLVTSWMETGSFATGAAAGRVFWRRWQAADGRDAEAVPAELVRALVQSLHFELVTYRTDRSELLDRWLDLAESVLTDGVPTTLDTFVALQELTP